MPYIQSTEIVKSIIEKNPIDLVIDSIVDNGDTWTLLTKNTYYINTSYKLEIEAGVFIVIKSFVWNESFTFNKTAFIPIIKTYQIKVPFFGHGVIKQFNDDIEAVPATNKFPFIYLIERRTDEFDRNTESNIDRNMPLNMFFLTNFDKQRKNTTHHYEEIIKPMSNMLDFFINLLNKDCSIKDVDKFKVTNYVHFGTYNANKGNEKQLLDAYVSGVGLDIQVVVLK